HWPGDHVANCVNAIYAGGEVLVDGYVPFSVQFDADTFQAQMVRIRHAANCNQYAVADYRFLPFYFDNPLAFMHSSSVRLARKFKCESLLLEKFPGFGGDLRVHSK